MSGGTMAAGDDFPMLCETCLGPNPYVRMTKLPPQNKLCTISHLPYQAFRWKAGPGGRYKETVVSYTIARERNLCQCCLNDMRFGVPVGVRDALLKHSERGDAQQQQIALPHSIAGVQYHARRLQEEQSAADRLQESEGGALSIWDEADAPLRHLAPTRQLEALSHSLYAQNSVGVPNHLPNNAPTRIAFRNLPKLCSFWMNAACNRVVRGSCPFRPCCGTFVFPEIAGSHKELHKKLCERLQAEGPEKVMKSLDSETRTAIQQALRGNKEEAIRKRVMGEDELTKSYLNRIKSSQNTQLEAPADQSIVTLWLGNVPPTVNEEEIRAAIEMYAPIASLRMARASQCAFVEFFERSAAELVANALYNALSLGGQPVRVDWAKAKRDRESITSAGTEHTTQDGVPLMLAPPGLEHAPRSMYSLPGLPLPVVPTYSTFAPPPPPPPPAGPPPSAAPPTKQETMQDSNNQEAPDTKRRKVQSNEGESTSGLAYLGDYADDDE